MKEKNVNKNQNQPEKFYAKFVAKPRLSKKDRKQAMIEEIWEEDDEDDWDEDEEDFVIISDEEAAALLEKEKKEKKEKPAHTKQRNAPHTVSHNEHRCPVSRKCSGCQMQNLSYQDGLRWKQAQEVRLLGAFGHISPIIGMENPLHYRNKVQTAFGMTRGGKIISGVWQSREQKIIATDSCMIEDAAASAIAVTVRKLLAAFKMTAWQDGNGFLRHILVRRGFSTGEIMVVLVAGTPVFRSKKNFVSALLRAHPEITTVIFTVNNSETNLLLGEREEVLYGKGYIEDTLCGLTFRISPRSFYQINPVQTETLYRTAIDFAGLTGRETVLDAYCGIGTIGLAAAASAGKVTGVEVNPDAVRDASANARLNNIQNIRFIEGDAGKYMEALAEEKTPLDLLFMDPPRAGASAEFIRAALTCAPKKIVYISCNPETLARDLKLLTAKKAYQVKKIQPVDMFPWTHHVETVVLLSKGEVDSKKIRVEFSLEDMDMSEFQDGATYTQIKDYVLEHSGLKVSNLYISQIKRKCGIGVGKNYNLPKSEDSRQPQCPPEKEKAIREAFKYFGII